ncbi:MAG TPA: GNAT family N-acetyltransferase [Vicinamibacterales bacterium]|nr:GNAT family N-acetyltransferase [Vicinamibacterales bacterium]
MKAPLRIETARLILRPPHSNDATAIFERYAGDPDVTRYLGWPRHHSVEQAEGFVQFSTQEWKRWPAGPYLIFSRDGGELLGGTGFGFQTQRDAMTGYVLARDAWGRGYATEVLAALVDLAPGLGISRLRALCHPEHRPSQRVLEKCGFVRDHTWVEFVEFPNLEPGTQQEALCFVRSVNAGGPNK